ncbi:MAG TPA: c-type cytochrome [Magnetovibrio sp.]
MRWTLGIAVVTSAVLAGGVALAQTPQPAPHRAAPAVPTQVTQALETCFECHGPNGVSNLPTRPTIAGQKADYVARQLQAFKRAAAEHARAVASNKDGDAKITAALPGRSDPIMEHMAAGLDDALVVPVSQAVSQLSCVGSKAADKPKAVPLMPTLAQRCVVCHGEDGIGAQPFVPNIAGQQRAYLRRQLLLIRETAWGAQPREHDSWRSHPIMESQAARISIEEVDTLANYYAALDCRGRAVGSATPAR